MSMSERVRQMSRSFCTHKKPRFQRKFKSRVLNNSTLDKEGAENNQFQSSSFSQQNSQSKHRSLLFSSKKHRNEQNFNETSCKLQNINFSHHDPNLCVCAHCTCGRHLCQFHAIKPDLSKNTIYQKDYFKKNPIQNRINISKEYDRLKGPNLETSSTYLKDFDQKQSQIERPRPQDLLKTGGPCNNLTTYSSGFPGYKGGNQYVKPTDMHTRGYFPLRSRSTYSNAFLGNPGKKEDYQKIPDNLKTGSNWFGSTTYGNNFKAPNPEDYANKYRVHQKLENNPDFNHQYQTIYRNSFLGRQPGVCPAKVVLQTRSKGFFSSSKNKFLQNADFKSLDPKFHSISTSKHCYV